MKRALLILLLAFGTIAGFASGIHQLRYGHGCHWGQPGGWPCEKGTVPPAQPPPLTVP
jgi:hypothetical protein